MEDLLSIEAVAQRFEVAPRTINFWVQHQQFPTPIRIGKKPFWRPADLDAYVQAREPEHVADRRGTASNRHSVRAYQNSTELQTMLTARRALAMRASQRYTR